MVSFSFITASKNAPVILTPGQPGPEGQCFPAFFWRVSNHFTQLVLIVPPHVSWKSCIDSSKKYIGAQRLTAP